MTDTTSDVIWWIQHITGKGQKVLRMIESCTLLDICRMRDEALRSEPAEIAVWTTDKNGQVNWKTVEYILDPYDFMLFAACTFVAVESGTHPEFSRLDMIG